MSFRFGGALPSTPSPGNDTTLGSPDDTVSSLAWSPKPLEANGLSTHILAASTWDGHVLCYSVSGSEQRETLKLAAHHAPILDVAWDTVRCDFSFSTPSNPLLAHVRLFPLISNTSPNGLSFLFRMVPSATLLLAITRSNLSAWIPPSLKWWQRCVSTSNCPLHTYKGLQSLLALASGAIGNDSMALQCIFCLFLYFFFFFFFPHTAFLKTNPFS